jgi:hypothetical protein
MVFILASVIYGMEIEKNLLKNVSPEEKSAEKTEILMEVNTQQAPEIEKKYEEMKIALLQKFNRKLDKCGKHCTECAKKYDSKKLFDILGNKKYLQCAKCIVEFYSEQSIVTLASHLKFEDTSLATLLGRDINHHVGYIGEIATQVSANTILCVLAVYMWIDQSNIMAHGEFHSSADRFGMVTRQILPFFFGSVVLMTIPYAVKFSDRMKEFKLKDLIPSQGAGFQLFISIMAAISYWGAGEHDITGKAVILYGTFAQISLWTGQNIGLNFYDKHFVNEWEYGFQKLLYTMRGKQIPQGVLENAWVPKTKWDFVKPAFVVFQVYGVLNAVASFTLLPYLNNPEKFGIQGESDGQMMLLGDTICWISLLFGVMLKLWSGAAQGPVLSMNVVSRMAVISAYAALPTLHLQTKFTLNILSLIFAFIVCIFWKK